MTYGFGIEGTTRALRQRRLHPSGRHSTFEDNLADMVKPLNMFISRPRIRSHCAHAVIGLTEQKQRFLSHLSQPQKHWKFSQGDLDERKLWTKYMKAYEDCINATSPPWAPWYAIPTDNKPYLRLCVAQIIANILKNLGLEYPKIRLKEKAQFSRLKKQLAKGG